jgi:putative ABC transport system ATP-binding protein
MSGGAGAAEQTGTGASRAAGETPAGGRTAPGRAVGQESLDKKSVDKASAGQASVAPDPAARAGNDPEATDAAGGLDRSLFRYIWRHSKRDQILICSVVLASLPLYFASLDLPRRIVNEAIQGHAFEHGNTVTKPEEMMRCWPRPMPSQAPAR